MKKNNLIIISILCFLSVSSCVFAKKTLVSSEELSAYAGFGELDDNEKNMLHHYVNRIDPMHWVYAINGNIFEVLISHADSLTHMKHGVIRLINGATERDISMSVWLEQKALKIKREADELQRSVRQNEQQALKLAANYEVVKSAQPSLDAFVEYFEDIIRCESVNVDFSLSYEVSQKLHALSVFMSENQATLSAMPGHCSEWMSFDFGLIQPLLVTVEELLYHVSYESRLVLAALLQQGFQHQGVFYAITPSAVIRPSIDSLSVGMNILTQDKEGHWNDFHAVNFSL